VWALALAAILAITAATVTLVQAQPQVVAVVEYGIQQHRVALEAAEAVVEIHQVTVVDLEYQAALL
jgi:NADPH-dependent glutamate synthase beta subunit-like oxidoreductase